MQTATYSRGSRRGRKRSLTGLDQAQRQMTKLQATLRTSTGRHSENTVFRGYHPHKLRKSKLTVHDFSTKSWYTSAGCVTAGLPRHRWEHKTTFHGSPRSPAQMPTAQDSWHKNLLPDVLHGAGVGTGHRLKRRKHPITLILELTQPHLARPRPRTNQAVPMPTTQGS